MNTEANEEPVRLPSPSAARMRRHRDRRRSGMRCVTICLTDAEIDGLVAGRYLGADERDDKSTVQAAVEAFISDELAAVI